MEQTTREHIQPPGARLGAELRRLVHTMTLGARLLELSKNDTVYGCNDQGRSVYLVERGQVKAVAPSVHGKDCLLGIHTPGDVFGESCLLGGPRTESVTAMTNTTLHQIPGPRLLDALAESDLRASFVRHLAYRVFEQQQLIVCLITADSESRLAVILLHLAHKLGRRDQQYLRIQQRITQEELSGMVGTTRSRVGYFLKKFRAAGLVGTTQDASFVIDEVRLSDFVAHGGIPGAPRIPTPRQRGRTVCPIGTGFDDGG